jgi:RNA ligase (TIGR02306 family)
MSTFEVPILAIDDVYDHPNADRLSILRIRGYEAITAKLEDGTHRFCKGEPIIYVPEGAVVQERDLKARGYWNERDGKGMLAGSQGNRVKAIKLRNVLSQGLVWKIEDHDPDDGSVYIGRHNYEIGADVAHEFGIVKYEEPIPTSMSGRVASVVEARFDYDIENLKAFPDLFRPGEPVVATEKLHGTFCRLSHVSGMEPREDMFGDGRVAIASKGLGARGLVFLNCVENLDGGNVYVRALDDITIRRFQDMAEFRYPGQTVHLMGEVFGRGVQDLSYGEQAPTFRAFDIFVEGLGFLPDDDKDSFFEILGVPRVPVLYEGPFDRAVIDALAAGSTALNRKLDAAEGPNIREGVVITAVGSQDKRDAGLGKTVRPILKHVSEAYLTRKGGTELQ